MEIPDEWIVHYRTLQHLLEEDLQQAGLGMREDILKAYENIVNQELAALEQNLRLIQYSSNQKI